MTVKYRQWMWWFDRVRDVRLILHTVNTGRDVRFLEIEDMYTL
jgi:hypothetical protein